jgi:hypothetical protein
MAAPCPPGTFRNPISSRCVKLTGRRARELYEGGYVDYGAMAAAAAPFQAYRQEPLYRPAQQARAETRRQGRPIDIAAAFGGRGSISSNANRTRRRYQPAYAIPGRQPAAPRIDPRAQPCPSTRQVRNPITGRCVVVGGRAFKQAGIAPVLAQPPPQPRVLRPAEVARRTESNAPADLPVHASAVAPLADRPTILGWAAGNCKEQRDAITGIPFRNMDAENLQQLVRLHTRACTLATPLNAKVAAEHRDGKIATIPGQSDTQMVLADFKALRDAMRRTNPAYKLPGRRHQPPPPTWKLYVGRDARSGPDYMSVMYVDSTKGRATGMGMEYPPEAVRVDLGFIPNRQIAGALCEPALITETLQRLADSNRLLEPVAGGWKPIAGFPFTKQYWTRETANRLSNLCRQLIRALTSPI